MNISEALAEQEEQIARIRNESPDFSVGPTRIVADEATLDDLTAFMNAEEGCEASKQLIVQFSTAGGEFLAVILKAKKSLGLVAIALARYCGLRKCKIAIKVKGVEIVSEASDAAELERLLKCADQLFIHRDK